jgi:hypothetical protein
MEQVFANVDLKRHIFSFGYPEHREFMCSIKESLKIDCEPFVQMYGQNHNERDMIQYIMEEYTEPEMLSSIRYFNRCRCCTRHSFKPFIKVVDGVTHVFNDSHNINLIKDCHCSCRHISRQIVNAFCIRHAGIIIFNYM